METRGCRTRILCKCCIYITRNITYPSIGFLLQFIYSVNIRENLHIIKCIKENIIEKNFLTIFVFTSLK